MKIAVDFDSTIAEYLFPQIGPLVPGAIYWLTRYQDMGAKLILWTCRSDGQKAGDVLAAAVEYCRAYGLEFEAVNAGLEPIYPPESRKIHADIYIDDAAFGCPLIPATISNKPMVDWGVVGPAIEQFIMTKEKCYCG